MKIVRRHQGIHERLAAMKRPPRLEQGAWSDIRTIGQNLQPSWPLMDVPPTKTASAATKKLSVS